MSPRTIAIGPMSGDGFAERCDLVADAFGALSHLDAKVCPSSVPVGWGEQVPRVVVGNATTGTVLVTLGDNGWQISGGSDPRTRIVVGEDLVESVAALLRGERLEAPAAYADWTGEEVNR